MRSLRTKIKERDELQGIVEGLKKDGKRVCFTNGCFDILHQGHVLYLEEARRHGDCLIVGVNTDSSVREIKGEDKPFSRLEGELRALPPWEP